MLMEDARDKARAAKRMLLRQRGQRGLQMPGLRILELAEFKARVRKHPLTREQKEVIVEQAIALLDQIYAHLPFKKARYAVNPVQKLRLLRARAARLEDAGFHEGMLEAFTELRDAHTYYSLPRPYRGKLAFLPFEVEAYGPRGERRFLVTRVMQGFEHDTFREGVELTRWNGVPMETALARMAALTPGATPDAGFVRALGRLTLRLLEFTLPPDEEMVFVEYEAGDARRVIALPWMVAEGWGSMLFRKGQNLSVSVLVATEKYGCNLIWGQEGARAWDSAGQPPRAIGSYGGPPVTTAEKPIASKLPDTFKARVFSLPDGTWIGHLRIKDFVPTPEDFTAEFARLLREIEKAQAAGLLLDIRGNPGGDIRSAELSLQYLTPQRIRPALFHYVNSALTQEIADIVERAPITQSVAARAEFRDWAEDLANATTSADAVTTGRSTTSEEEANDTGQIYQQPVVLIVDPSVYSAAEIFAGGFIDHAIGQVLGVGESTGGGGANRWDHAELVSKLGAVPGLPLSPMPGGSTLRKLPRGAEIAVAVRRSSRVGPHAGEAIEDIGLKPDVVHVRTLADLLDHDQDLLAKGAGMILQQPSYMLRIDKVKLRWWNTGGVRVEGIEIRTRICRTVKVEAWVDGELIGAMWPGSDGRDIEKPSELVAMLPAMRRLRPTMTRLQLLGYNAEGRLCVAAAAPLTRALRG